MKKTNKILATLTAIVLIISALVSCATELPKDNSNTVTTAAGTTIPDVTTSPAEVPYESVNMRVFAMNGPTGMGMSKLISDDENKLTANDYEFTLVSSADDMKAEIIKGEYEIAAVPTNLAAVLYGKTEGALKVAAVNTLGVLYILENGETINSVNDLDGKTIAATGEGSVPEYVLNYILKANNVNATIEYYTDGAELAAKMISGDVKLGMLPVPYATNVLSKSENVRIAIDITKEWSASGNDAGALCQGCVIVRSDFAAENPKAVDKFLEEYASSVAYVNGNVDEASVLLEKYGIVAAAAVGKAAIPSANIVCITGQEMADDLVGFYKVLFDANPKSVGGKLPDDALYYISK